MSNQSPDYAAVRRNVEKNVARQKSLYRILFFVMHLIFYAATMAVVWGTVANSPELRDLLFNNESNAAAVVIFPTILWTAVILFHVAALFLESRAGERELRERFFMREVGEEMLRTGLVDEKPKRHFAAQENERTRLSDDGELITVDDDEPIEQPVYTRASRIGES